VAGSLAIPDAGQFPPSNGGTLQSVGPAVPFIDEGAIPDIRGIRDEWEHFYLGFIIAVNVIVWSAALVFVWAYPQAAMIALLFAAPLALLSWIAWKLTYSMIYGHSVRVGPNQYPQIDRLVRAAAQRLGIQEPTVLVLNGHGIVELFLAKRFTRRGVIILTSNLFEAMKERSSSRELMMVVGRQLGHIMAGHYRFWFLKDVVGALAIGFHAAWKRRCHFTADRIGLLVTGDLLAAEQGLLIVAVGDTLAAGTNIDELQVQRDEHFDDVWTWIRLTFEHYPYLVDRVVRLRRFATAMLASHALQPSRIGAIRLQHQVIRSLPVFIIHGHDRGSLLELKNFLFTKFPNVMPLVMAEDTMAAATLPEKLEAIAGQVSGAIALVTPDDLQVTGNAGDATGPGRARQNVVLEIGWFWARLGRERCLLLRKGEVDLPSDLSGIEWQQFIRTPTECSESIRDFLNRFDAPAAMRGAGGSAPAAVPPLVRTSAVL
jgi:Zn-dependent protease with chaperone function